MGKVEGGRKEGERDGGKRGRMICRRKKEDGREKEEIPQIHEELSLQGVLKGIFISIE